MSVPKQAILVDSDDAIADARAAVGQMQKAVEALRQSLFRQGRTATDLYIQMAKENAFGPDETKLFPRVRLDKRYGSPSFYWERLIRHVYPITPTKPLVKTPGKGRSYEAFVRRKGSSKKEKMRVVLLSEHVPINKKTLSVPMRVFDGEPEWARLAAQLIEPQLTALRVQNKALSDISRALIRLVRLMEKDNIDGATDV